jgi:hypothetical protein
MFEPFGKWEYSQGDLRDDPSAPLFEMGASFAGIPHFNPTTEGGNNTSPHFWRFVFLCRYNAYCFKKLLQLLKS